MRSGVLTGMSGNWEQAIEKVKIAESLGYEMVATGDVGGLGFGTVSQLD